MGHLGLYGKEGLAERLTNPGRKGKSRKTSAWSSPKRHQSGSFPPGNLFTSTGKCKSTMAVLDVC